MCLVMRGDLPDHDVGGGTRDRRQIVVLGHPVARIAQAVGEPRQIERIAQAPARRSSRRRPGRDRGWRAGSWLLSSPYHAGCHLLARAGLRMINSARRTGARHGRVDRMEGAAVSAAARGGLFLRSRARALLGGRPAFDHPARRLHRRNARRRARRQRRADRQRPGADHRLSDHRGRRPSGCISATAAWWKAMRSASTRRPASAWCRRSARSICRRLPHRLLARGRDRRTRGDRRRRRAHPLARRPHRRQAGIRRLLGIRAGRGDLHLSGASQLGRHRADLAQGRIDRHRLAAARARARGQERASQHGGADRSA